MEYFGEKAEMIFVTLDYEWNVNIRHLGVWRPISVYLQSLKPHNAWEESMSKVDIMHLRWRQQTDWRNENGKVFPFMKLSREIRDIVYEHL